MRTLLVRWVAFFLVLSAILTAMMTAAFGADPVFRDPRQGKAKAGLWPHVVFALAGDYADFTRTMAKTRDQVRRELWNEFGDILIPMAYSYADASQLAETLSQILIAFDGEYKRQRKEANEGIPESLEASFKAEFDRLYRQNNLSDNERKAEFIADLDLAKKPWLDAFMNVDFLMHGSYTVLARGKVEIVLTIEKYSTGQSRTFSSSGFIDVAIRDLAFQVFTFFQSQQYPDWQNPQPELTWIAPPVTELRALASKARLYCRGQVARLPFARELILASQGGYYRNGGIPALNPHDIYIISDKQRTDEQYYYFNESEGDPRGPVRSDAGYGPIKGAYWCVRGNPSQEVLFVESLYRLVRMNSDEQLRRPIEFLLNQIGDFGARQSYRYAFRSVDEALAALQAQGVILQIPAGML